MKKIIFVFCSILICFSSCLDEKISNSVTDLPTFSTDTVSFDTIFTTITTATARVKVYNPHKSAIVLSSIALSGGDESPFRINVNGQNGMQFSNIRISGGDSIYLFVQATVDPTNENNPILFMDSVKFSVNGVDKFLQLRAYGQDAYVVKNKTIVADTTFTATKPILIYGDLTIEPTATLTVESGASLYFHSKASVVANGKLIVNGLATAPVVFRADRTDYIFKNVPYDSLSGQWQGVFLNSPESELNHAEIRNAEYGLRAWNDTSFTPTVMLRSCKIHNCSKEGLSLKNVQLTAENTMISNCAEHCVNLLGGNSVFTHCTIANYYPKSGRVGCAILVQNQNFNNQGDLMLYPHVSKFRNSIIAGSFAEEISYSTANKNGEFVAALDASFQNCLIVGTEDNVLTYQDCIWATTNDILFENTKTYPYDFSLTEQSLAVDTANVEISNLLPIDRKGQNRLAAKPDLGSDER